MSENEVKSEETMGFEVIQEITPKYQTRFGGSMQYAPKDRGNCFVACVASFIGYEVEDMLQVQEFFEKDNVNGCHWFTDLQTWLNERGFKIRDFTRNDDETTPYIQGFTKKDGTKHAVIFKGGKVFHDPHPIGLSGGELILDEITHVVVKLKMESDNGVLGAVSSSVHCCAFCQGSMAHHAIDKGKWSIDNVKESKVWICSTCLINHNQHRVTHHPTESIMYIAKITKGDRARMWRSLH